MKITKKFRDNKIDQKILDYGVGRMAKEIDVSRSYLYGAIQQKHPISWKFYILIQKALKDET